MMEAEELAKALCRRLNAHEWGTWRKFGHPVTGQPWRESRSCQTCGRAEGRELPAGGAPT